MQKHSIRQRIQRKERWCRKMEKKLAVIVDNKEITTEVTNTEMCSSACDVAVEMCSRESDDTCGSRVLSTSGEFVEVLNFRHFARYMSFTPTGKKKQIMNGIEVSVVLHLV